MIVCLCRAKTDRDVLEVLEDGAESLRDFQRCGIGTDCGTCHNMLRMMLAAACEESAVAAPPIPRPPATAVTSA